MIHAKKSDRVGTDFRRFRRPLCVILLVLAVLPGCAARFKATGPALHAKSSHTAAASPIVSGDELVENDPIEPLNRFVFGFNEILDGLIFRPAGKVYRAVLPEKARDSIRNFLRNLAAPIILANDLLQGEGKRAGKTVTRFVINTTVGVVGLFDVAAEMGYPFHREDFGQTLAVYGAGEGPYLVLPIFGPSNLRDVTGRLVDVLLNPFVYVASANNAGEWLTAERSIAGVDKRSRNIENLEELKKDSLDYYARIRHLYRQARRREIQNGRLDFGGSPFVSSK